MEHEREPVWHAVEADELFGLLATAPGGLTAGEARRRLGDVGANTLPRAERAGTGRILRHQFTGALTAVLAVACVLSLAIGHWEDAVVIGIVLVLNATIGFFQEYRAEHAIAALMNLVAPRATVLRDGVRLEVPSSELVPGDVVLLESGARVPADLRLVALADLEVDEALLTGESTPVAKTPDALPGGMALPVAERTGMVFMGTAVASGRGRGLVVATGPRTELGRIAGEMRGARRAPTPLQVRMDRFGRRISAAVVAASALTFVVGWARGAPAPEMFLTAVAIAVSAVPEGLPVVMTIALAVSVRRMARRNAIVRRLPAVETLGSCTVVVTDKTGTLTRNRMTVQQIVTPDGLFRLTGGGLDPRGEILRGPDAVEAAPGSALHGLLLVGALCNEADLDARDPDHVEARGDPTEVALLVAAAKAGLDRAALARARPERSARPFESQRRYAATLRDGPEGRLLLVKGAPERVAAMCSAQLGAAGLEPVDRRAVAAAADAMADEGLRVLGFAFAAARDTDESLQRGDPGGLVFLGLAGMLDPPRPGTPRALADCRAAGIRVVMVTGDHARTAGAIARRIGLDPGPAGVVEGAMLAELDDEGLLALLREASVFARVGPADKHRIVRVLTGAGEVVAVTGDGVNDAPALKAAHVGAAMGLRGTDVAVEASDIVLADDDFATVGAAVAEGRTAFANLRNATLFLVSSGVGELLAILGSLALRLPLPLLPAQILWLNVVTNGVEDVALAMEPGDDEAFRRPPRDPGEGVLSPVLVERVVVSGVVMAIGTLAIFVSEWGQLDAQLGYARTAALTSLVAFQVYHVGNCRSEYRSIAAKSPFSNRFLLFGAAGSALIHVAALHLPLTQRFLRLEPLEPGTWLRIAAVGLSIVFVVELHKKLRPPPAPAAVASPPDGAGDG